MTYKCVFVTNSLSETEIRASGDTKRPLAPKVPKWDNDLRVSFRYISHLRYIKAPPFSSCASIFKMSKNYTVPYRSTVIFSLNSRSINEISTAEIFLFHFMHHLKLFTIFTYKNLEACPFI